MESSSLAVSTVCKTSVISTIVDLHGYHPPSLVCKTSVISTIVDFIVSPSSLIVCKTSVISTIVDNLGKLFLRLSVRPQ